MDASAALVAARVWAGVMALAVGFPRTGRPMNPYRNIVASVSVTARFKSAIGMAPERTSWTKAAGEPGLMRARPALNAEAVPPAGTAARSDRTNPVNPHAASSP